MNKFAWIGCLRTGFQECLANTSIWRQCLHSLEALVFYFAGTSTICSRRFAICDIWIKETSEACNSDGDKNVITERARHTFLTEQKIEKITERNEIMVVHNIQALTRSLSTVRISFLQKVKARQPNFMKVVVNIRLQQKGCHYGDTGSAGQKQITWLTEQLQATWAYQLQGLGKPYP